MDHTTATESINRELVGGETLLWQGRPKTGPILYPGKDLAYLPAGMAWAYLFTYLSGDMVIRTLYDAVWSFCMTFVVVLYAAVGFGLAAWRRGRTHYALTNHRALVLRPNAPALSVGLGSLGRVRVTRGYALGGCKTVWFGDPPKWYQTSLPGMWDSCRTPGFELEPQDADRVHALAQNAMKRG